MLPEKPKPSIYALCRSSITGCPADIFSRPYYNGRAYDTVLRLSSSVCTKCIVAKRYVLEQKLLLTAYRKSYMRNRLVPKS